MGRRITPAERVKASAPGRNAVAATETQSIDNQRLKRERVERIQAEMKRLGVGGLYISDAVYLQYVLSAKIPGAKVFVPATGDPIALVRGRDVGYVAMVHERIAAPFYNNTWEPQNDAKIPRFSQGIADLMAQNGAAGERLGIDTLEAPAFMALLQQGINVTDARPIMEYAKSIKTQDEITDYRQIGQHYRTTYTAFRDAIQPGRTEKELAAIVMSTWHQVGGDEVRQLNVCSGEHMNPWRRWPTTRALKAGELVGIDFHGRSEAGQMGDVSRTFMVGDRPSTAQRDLYARAFDYLDAVTDLFRAGRPLPELLASVPKVPDSYRDQLWNYNVAHPIGMTPSGYPMVHPDRPPVDDVLRTDMVFAIESYFGEKGGELAVKAEHMIRVTDGPPEIFDAQVPQDPTLRG
ncbi:MAG: family peptidase [Chloroflexi bacterium]|nr:family peptidase [Chloroflexota bacterium]